MLLTTSDIAAQSPSGAGGLFTAASLLSLQGSTAACLIVPNVLGMLIGDWFTPRMRNWCAFSMAEILAYATAATVQDGSWYRWLIALLNGFIIFASAYGVDAVGAQRRQHTTRRSDDVMQGAPVPNSRRFFVRWEF